MTGETEERGRGKRPRRDLFRAPCRALEVRAPTVGRNVLPRRRLPALGGVLDRADPGDAGAPPRELSPTDEKYAQVVGEEQAKTWRQYARVSSNFPNVLPG